VQEVIKGDLPNAVKIPVVVPGGLRRFPDGSVVLLQATSSTQPQNGGTYVFFLGKQSGLYDGREVVGGFQGVFELTAGQVARADLADDPVAEKYSGIKAGTFLAKLRAQREPNLRLQRRPHYRPRHDMALPKRDD
jgi:hypothetical protein